MRSLFKHSVETPLAESAKELFAQENQSMPALQSNQEMTLPLEDQLVEIAQSHNLQLSLTPMRPLLKKL
jgi:hypothetical protein